MQTRGVYLPDVIAGNGPAPSYVLAVIAGLPDTSLTAALAAGGRDYYGWGIDRYMLAEIYDSLNLNTQATGQWKKAPPKFKPFPRPRITLKDAPKKKVTIRDLYQGFTTRLKRER